VLSADGSIQSLRNGRLTLGGTTTGNIVLSPNNGSGTLTFSNFTTAGGVLYTTSAGLLQQVAAGGVSSQCLLGGNGTTPAWGSCSGTPGAASPFYQDDTLKVVGENLATYDFLLGGSASTSAKFAVMNMAGGNPTIQLRDSTGANPATIANSAGDLILSAPTGTVQVGSGTGNVSITLSNAADILNTTKTVTLGAAYSNNDFNFKRILTGAANTQNGSVVNILDLSTGTADSRVDLLRIDSRYSGGGAFNGSLFKAQVNGVDHFVISGNDTTPIASVSGSTSFAAFAINQTGTGDIFTASKSGVNKFVIDGSGRVGIGTSSAYLKSTDMLTVSGDVKIEAKPVSKVNSTTWTKITDTVPGTIVSGGTSGIASASAAVVYNGSLYIGTIKAAGAEVYRYNGSAGSWDRVNIAAGQFSSNTGINGVLSMTVHNGQLYIGTEKPNGGEVYRFNGMTNGVTPTAASWTAVNTAPGTFGAQTNVDGVSSMISFKGRLYIGTKENLAASFYMYLGGASSNTWVLSTSAAGTACSTTAMDEITSIQAIGGVLVSASRKGHSGVTNLCRVAGGDHSGGLVFSEVAFGYDMAGSADISVTSISAQTVYNGRLMLGVRKSVSAYVIGLDHPYHGASALAGFQQMTSAAGVVTQGGTSGIDGITSMTVYNGKLYAGTDKQGTAGAGEAEVYQYSGDDRWIKVSQSTAGQIASGGTTGISNIDVLIPWNGNLYALTHRGGGTARTVGSGGPGGLEVYEYTGSELEQSSYAIKFHSTNPGDGTGGELGGFQNIGSIYFNATSSASFNGGNNQGSFIFSHGLQTTGGGFDVAEDYPTWDPDVGAGDVVAISPNEPGFIEKSSGGTYYGKVLGVVSEKPGFRLSQKDDFPSGSFGVPVALVGRVDVKVSTENGTIKAGDALTTSSTPGVVMKATQPGMVIGRAMGDFDCSYAVGPFAPDESASSSASASQICEGKVLTYINVSYYDPKVAFTALGDLNVVDVLDVDHENDVLAQVLTDPERFEVRGKNGEKITAVGAFKEAAIGSLKAGSIDVTKLSINGIDVTKFLIGQNMSATDAANLGQRMAEMNDTVDSHEQKIDSLTDRLNNLEELVNMTASNAAFLSDTRMTELSNASESANITQALTDLDVENATVSGNLTVLGRTVLSNLGVTGNINAGVLVFDGDTGSINNVGGTLKLQSLGAGGIDILAGKVKIDTEGNITTAGNIIAETIKAKSIETKKLKIDTTEEHTNTAVLSASAGTIIIRAGQTSVDVSTTALTTKSLVFTTPEDPIAIGSKKKDSDTFRISLQSVLTKDLKVNWWIVN
jgi:hypothetical protein